VKPTTSLATLLSLALLASAQTSSPPGKDPPPTETRPPERPKEGKTGTAPAKPAAPSPAPAKPARSGLEKALEEALTNNPDLRVAAARAGEAEAVLARARLQVTQKVVTAYQTVELNKATSDVAQAQLGRLQALKARVKNAVSEEDLTRAETEVTAARARLATAEADLDYLLGKSAARATGLNLNYSNGNSVAGGFSAPFYNTYGLDGRAFGSFFLGMPTGTTYNYFGTRLSGLSTTRSEPELATDKLRTVLDRRISVKFNDTPASEALKTLAREAQGVHIQASLKDDAWKEKVTATLTDVPFSAALQLLEDTLTDHRVVVRGYGLLIARKEHVPAGGVLLDDLRHAGPLSDGLTPSNLRAPKVALESNPPRAQVEGTVTRVAEGGLVTVSVGSDAGLTKGHTLEVFRLGTTPRYLGRLRIVEVAPKQAVGQQIAGAAKEAIKSGDRVASQVTRSK
jgi:hypothetical protein